MTAHLSPTDQARLTRLTPPHQHRRGPGPVRRRATRPPPALVLAPLPARALARHARQHPLPPVLSALTTSRPHAHSASAPGLRAALAAQTPEQQLHTLTTLVATSTATVLAHPDPTALDTELAFKDLGIDSLTALELRNALTRATGLTLPPTLVFDHPTPAALARHIHRQLSQNSVSQGRNASEVDIHRLVASIPIQRLQEEGILEILLDMSGHERSGDSPQEEAIANMELDELMNFALSDESDE